MPKWNPNPTQKPPLGSRIKWDHRLAKGLRFAALMNEGSGCTVDAVTRIQATPDGTTWRETDIAQAIDLNGSTDRLDWANIWDPTGLPITVCVKVRFDALANNGYIWLNHAVGDGAYAALVYVTTAGALFFTRNTSAGNVLQRASGTTLVVGRWYTLTITHTGLFSDATTIRIYVDGKEGTYASPINGGTELAGGGSWSIGGRKYDDARNVNGQVAYALVANDVWTPEQAAAQHYEPYAMFEWPCHRFYSIGAKIQLFAHYYRQLREAA